MTFKGSDVLPANATPLERAMADTDWAQLALVNADVVATIVNPATCPLALLPWLAWSLSVDVWDDTWDEATQRAVIAASPAVHRSKGTRFAVRTSLEAVNVISSIQEWWETSPAGRRGTFTVTIVSDGIHAPITISLIEQVQQIVTKAKRKSISFKVRVSAEEDGLIYGGGVQQNVFEITIGPDILESTDGTSLLTNSNNVMEISI